MTELLFDNVNILGDIPCSREDFIKASTILDNPEINVYEAIDDILSNGDNDGLKKILKIARRRATANGIVPGRPTASEEILRSLENGVHLQTRGVAIYVRQIIDGPINSTLERNISPIIQEMQTDVPNDQKLTTLNVQILAKIGLQEYCVGDLTKFFASTSASMSGLLDDIERKGYIERYNKTGPEEDKRKIYLQLTEKGKHFVTQVEEKLREQSL